MAEWLVVRVKALADGTRHVIVLAEVDRSGAALDTARGLACPDGYSLVVCQRSSLPALLKGGRLDGAA